VGQSATVWFFDKNVGEDVRLVDEIQMLDLFEMYKSEMRCQVIVSVFNNEVCDEHEYDWLLARAYMCCATRRNQ
jgi:hypothetical protein